MNLILKGVVGVTLLHLSFNGLAAPVSDPELSQNHSLLSQQLGLTPGQIEKLEKLKSAAEKSLGSIDISNVSDEEIAKSFETGKWDEEAIKQELGSIGQVQAQARYYRLLYLFRVSQVLTSEQKEKFDVLLKQHELY
ncbi:hypothetical protein SMKC049_04570 [Serratia marcescens]|nr:hypothetical protein SMKC049_04570 [Serratia marcescens]